MKILSYVKSLDGSSYHRIYEPNRILDADVRTVNNITEDDIKWCDILHYSRHTHYSPKFLSELRNKYGFKIIVDTDDWWEVNSDHPKYKWWSVSNVALQIRNHMMVADAVTCTHEDLAAIVPNKNVYVIPNGLNYGDGQFAYKEQQQSDRVRLLYASTIMNYSNTAIISGSAKYIYEMGDVEYVISNAEKSEFFDKLVSNLTSGVIPYSLMEWSPADNYMTQYVGDIGILPSKDTKFNHMKSNLKVLEYGAMKIPAVVSMNKPYIGLPVNYFLGMKEFLFHVERLIKDKKYRINKGEELYDFCVENYHIKKFSDLRMSVYEKVQRGNSNRG